ncbi:sugar ABC transporter permease [Paenibacillus lycopersici]|uniref:Sugar ABC transporter permease n=1 Tax=Paenibacillus lycopersici TaxID=2704462 RepID=A0A6C0G2Y7_9BACL|nr:ABC transporter permease subunit [Paenibacillus lycopersici]QHT62333.1 sugar ABC transporter permease [Paenibacillus lycopersici]
MANSQSFAKRFKKNRTLFFMSLPGIIYKLIFAYIPMLGLIIAFKNYRYDQGIFGSEWVGLKNFRFFFENDKAFVITRNTVLYNVGFFVLTTVVSVFLAILLNEITRKFIKFYQTVMFLPYFLSWVVISYIVFAFLDHDHGFVNQLLGWLGMEHIPWYQEASRWPWILNIVSLWKTIGMQTLIYYAGVIGIDTGYYEAARIDGASKFRMMRTITIPLLTPLIVIFFIMAMGGIFRADFGLFYMVPNDSSFVYSTTDVIDTYIYRALRTINDLGMSTAVGFYQSLVGFVLVLASNFVVKKINNENSMW